ncbi:DUF4910 domain-containing protein [Sporosarcina sp. SAFN-015]|uniref:DUF4910 domain-containing protein n=1 Tax=Sporosarcina sp. SAFN-015 TaxID=3387274 RepID=UPI003F80507B
MKKSFREIANYVSGDRIFMNLKEISNFHRIQASTGYRMAANFCKNKLVAEGFKTTLRTFKADGSTWYLTSKSFKEWDCKKAYCDLISPEFKRIADFDADNISIIQRSYPCDYRKKPLEIVYLDKGNCKDNYRDIELNGKIIFVRDHFQSYVDWAIKEQGALGIITDYIPELKDVRTRYDLLDIRAYTSFWWKHTDDEPKTFGFVLTPRQGDELAKVCITMKAEGRYPKMNCYIESSLYEGEIEAVETVMPGTIDEEILIISHLCHPRTCANDNSSGVSSSMEALKSIKDLIEKGRLLPLKRTIRMVFIPEFTGTYAYLNSLGDNISKIKAGINMDMVGGRQDKGHGPLTISGLPHSTPSFVADLAALALDEVKKDVISHNKDNYVSMFNSVVSEFQAGSDHIILSDPTINIPTIMLGQWPDKYYHTSGDTIDEVDPFILQKSASIAASYLYSLANLKVADVPIILNKSRERLVTILTKLIDSAFDEKINNNQLQYKINCIEKSYILYCDDYKRFFQFDETESVDRIVENEKIVIKELINSLFTAYLNSIGKVDLNYEPPLGKPEYDYIPVRKYKAPILHHDDYALNDVELMEAFKDYSRMQKPKVLSPHLMETITQYYINGELTVNEIAQQVTTEIRDGDVEYVHEYVQLLVKYGLVEIK